MLCHEQFRDGLLVAKDSDKELIPAEEVNAIFNGVDMLVSTNTALLDQLEPLIVSWHPYTSLVGAVFLSMVPTVCSAPPALLALDQRAHRVHIRAIRCARTRAT
jgi:hypothetical protein